MWQFNPCSPCCTTESGVLTTCCGNRIPETLFATITRSGGCSCLTSLMTLAYNAGVGEWQGSALTGCSVFSFVTFTFTDIIFNIRLKCDSGVWKAFFTCNIGGLFGLITASSAVCSPLSLIWNSPGSNDCCGDAGGTIVQVEITE